MSVSTEELRTVVKRAVLFALTLGLWFTPVPAGLTGNQQVTIAIGGVTSPAATLPLQ